MSSFWFELFVRELKRILTDRRVITLLAGGPFFYALLFGGVYWNGRTKDVPIVIVDQDHSRLSRDIALALEGSENLKVVGWINSTDEFFPLVRREVAYACIEVPPHFERDVLAGRQPRVGVVYDGSNVLATGSTLSAIRTIVATYQVGLERTRLEAVGMSPAAARAASMPLTAATRQLFNPASSYSDYILMGLICVAIQSVTRISCGISLELDSGSQLTKVLPDRSINLVEIFTSKLAATATIALPVAYLAMSLPFVLFGAPYRGSVVVLALVLPLFVLIQICFGYGYAAICKSPVISTQLHLFMSVVLFTLSGFTWPYYVMPAWVRAIAFVTPLFHMNCLVRKLALVGAPWYLVYPHLLALAVFSAAALAWGLWAVRKRMDLNPAVL